MIVSCFNGCARSSTPQCFLQLSPASSYLLRLHCSLFFILVLPSALLSICHHLLHPLMVSTPTLVAAAPSAPSYYLQSHEPRPFTLQGCIAIAIGKEWWDSKNLRMSSKSCFLTPPETVEVALLIIPSYKKVSAFLFFNIRSTPIVPFFQTGLPLTRTEPDVRDLE